MNYAQRRIVIATLAALALLCVGRVLWMAASDYHRTHSEDSWGAQAARNAGWDPDDPAVQRSMKRYDPNWRRYAGRRYEFPAYLPWAIGGIVLAGGAFFVRASGQSDAPSSAWSRNEKR